MYALYQGFVLEVWGARLPRPATQTHRFASGCGEGASQQTCPPCHTADVSAVVTQQTCLYAQALAAAGRADLETLASDPMTWNELVINYI